MLPITPQGNAGRFYQAFRLRIQGRAPAAATFLVALLAASCGRDPAFTCRFEPTSTGLKTEVVGRPGETVLAFAGPPTGPHIPRTDGRVWTTVPSDPLGENAAAVGTARCDAEGRASFVVAWRALPPGDETCVQALAVDFGRGPFQSRPYPCAVLRGREADAVVVSHVAALATGAHALVPYGVLVAAGVVLWTRRRLRGLRVPRGVGVLAAAALATPLVLVRATAPPFDGEPSPAKFFPLKPASAPADGSVAAALDRVTKPGFSELLARVRAAAAPDERVTVVGRKNGDLPERLVLNATTRLDGRPVAFTTELAATSRPGLVLSLLGPGAAAPGDVLYAGAAGAVLRNPAASRPATRAEAPR